jgi:hypothetical protein
MLMSIRAARDIEMICIVDAWKTKKPGELPGVAV